MMCKGDIMNEILKKEILQSRMKLIKDEYDVTKWIIKSD